KGTACGESHFFRRPGLQFTLSFEGPRRKTFISNGAFTLSASADFWRKPVKGAFRCFSAPSSAVPKSTGNSGVLTPGVRRLVASSFCETTSRRNENMRRLPFRFWIAVLVTLSVTQVAAAQNWQRLGPEGGMVVSLGAATGGRLYLGTADGHVFASEDGAGRWEMRGRVSNRTDAVISRLVAGPRESNL